jgi:hypothetical protein
VGGRRTTAATRPVSLLPLGSPRGSSVAASRTRLPAVSTRSLCREKKICAYDRFVNGGLDEGYVQEEAAAETDRFVNLSPGFDASSVCASEGRPAGGGGTGVGTGIW